MSLAYLGRARREFGIGPFMALMAGRSDGSSTRQAEDRAMKLRAEFEPTAVGEVRWIDGKLVFPKLPDQPGIYLLTFKPGTGSAIIGQYVGEADNLARRMAHYRNPGPTQRTNLRMNTRMLSYLQIEGGRIQLSIVTNAGIDIDGDLHVLDLRQREGRRLVENALVIAARRSGCRVENI